MHTLALMREGEVKDQGLNGMGRKLGLKDAGKGR